jgi:ABC-type spermidine/putrescine transport system permease subunit II
VASAFTVLLSFPFAYFVAAKVPPSRRLIWILVAIIPFWTSYLIRVLAWLNMFGDEGLINKALTRIGVIQSPLDFFGFGRPAIVITFVYLLFPLSFLATYIAVERINPAMLDAAADLGARPWRRLVTITLPTARSGIVAGFVFAFISMMGDYATPQLIGGTNGTLYANLITNQFGYSLQWGFGATLAFLFLVTILLLVTVLRLMVGGVEAVGEYTGGFTRRRAPFLFGYSVLYLIFLDAPPALLILLAFNNSEDTGLPFVGFTTRWFDRVFDNPVLLESLWTSLQVAIAAALTSAVFGTLAAVQIARVKGRLRSFNLGIIAVPLFLPPLVLGLAIIGGLKPHGIQRGLWTIIAGHIILTLPVVTLLVLVRLEGLDRNQEIAAMDLGARPWVAFLTVSVPQALPGILAGVMIAFAISMDEFILTFLVTGSQQTLPLYIFGSLRIRVTPELNAISALMLGASFALLTVGALVAIGRERLRGRAGAAARIPFTEESLS